MPLRLMSETIYDEINSQIDAVDIVLIYSDGITKHRAQGSPQSTK